MKTKIEFTLPVPAYRFKRPDSHIATWVVFHPIDEMCDPYWTRNASMAYLVIGAEWLKKNAPIQWAAWCFARMRRDDITDVELTDELLPYLQPMPTGEAAPATVKHITYIGTGGGGGGSVGDNTGGSGGAGATIGRGDYWHTFIPSAGGSQR